MARFPDYQPSFRLVNSVGTVTGGPWRFDVASGAPATYGITLGSTEPWYVDENIGPFLNYQWSEIAYNLGYRYYVNLDFVFIEGQSGNSNYGLTLLDNLFRLCAENQVTYAMVQFSLAAGAPFYGIVPAGGGGMHPHEVASKQGYYELALSFKSRDLQAGGAPWGVPLLLPESGS
jgi:hypothetical protein